MGVLANLVILMLEIPPAPPQFTADVEVLRDRQRTCLASGRVFKIETVPGGWLTRCKKATYKEPEQ
jgi:hypothetical protein